MMVAIPHQLQSSFSIPLKRSLEFDDLLEPFFEHDESSPSRKRPFTQAERHLRQERPHSNDHGHAMTIEALESSRPVEDDFDSFAFCALAPLHAPSPPINLVNDAAKMMGVDGEKIIPQPPQPVPSSTSLALSFSFGPPIVGREAQSTIHHTWMYADEPTSAISFFCPRSHPPEVSCDSGSS